MLQLVARLHNNSDNRKMFSIWSALCPELCNRAVNKRQKINARDSLLGNCVVTRLYNKRRCFLCEPFRGYTRRFQCPCGGGFEYLHHEQASRRRRRKGKSQIWESKLWSRVPRDTDQRKTTLARASSIYKIQTRPLVREGAPEKQDRNYQRIINIQMGLDTKIYWLTDRQSQCDFDFDFRVEAGSNASTVTLRVVGGDKKKSLEFGTVKYCCESHETRIRKWMRWRKPAAIANDRPILSSEKMLYKDCDRKCSYERKLLAVSLKGLGAKTNLLAVNRQS
jgi:hypothetical protein